MAKQGPYNLDVSSPEEVSAVLSETAQFYYESAGELEADWQDPEAGRPWTEVAKILEQAAASIDKKAKGWY